VSIIWVIGKIVGDGQTGEWMCEGLFDTEDEASRNAEKEEFIAEVIVGRRLTTTAVDHGGKLYWPHLETWETSSLFKLQKERTLKISDKADIK
jgi:hypothetical protein